MTNRYLPGSLMDTRLVGAACALTPGLHDDRADKEPKADWEARAADAVEVCHGCPLRGTCEQVARELRPSERSGVWHGLYYRHGSRKAQAIRVSQ